MANGAGTCVAINKCVIQVLVSDAGDSKDPGRQNDLIITGIVIGVIGLWRHSPFGPIDGLIQLIDLVVVPKDIGIDLIVYVRSSIDFQGRKILPLIWVADLFRNLGEFFE